MPYEQEKIKEILQQIEEHPEEIAEEVHTMRDFDLFLTAELGEEYVRLAEKFASRRAAELLATLEGIFSTPRS